MTDLERYNQFSEAAMLNHQHDPWRRRKKSGMTIAIFEIVEESGNNWWYDDFVGVEFMGLIEWDSYYESLSNVKRIKQITAIAMIKNVYINHGRTLSPEHVIMK